MKSFLQLCIILSISLLASVASWLLQKPKTETTAPICNRAELKADEICMDEVVGKVLWIDARSREEWLANGVEGSILWNLDPKEDLLKFEADAVPAILSAEKVIVYCKSKKCDTSRLVAEKIRKLDLGIEVKILYGGWAAIEASHALKK